MEKYTEEFKQIVEDSKIALTFSIPLVIAEEATIQIENNKGGMKGEASGGPITQLLMLATATQNLIKALEADKEEEDEDVDILALFLSAMEIADEISEVEKK